MTKKNVVIAALGILVASLLLGSMATTSALWADDHTDSTGTITTGNLELAPGSGTAPSFTFPALNGSNVPIGGVSSASLTIRNTGTTALRFRISTAGPTVTTPAGTAVSVAIAGSVSTCPASGPSAFTSATVTSPTAITGTWQNLPRGGETVWCISATLTAVNGMGPATYTISFTFDAEQTRP